MRTKFTFVLSGIVLFAATVSSGEDSFKDLNGNGQMDTYENFALSMDKRIGDLLGRLTLEEKISLCHGNGGMGTTAVKRLGIGSIIMNDGPYGVRAGGRKTYFPTGLSLASSWDTQLAKDYEAALARETKAAGNRVLLGPGVNIMRTPLCGRNFEYMGEDPYLAGIIASAYIEGVQSEDVAACIKHLVCNNQEYWRTTISSEVDERALREIYLPAFRMACKQANVWAIMSAYNKLNGTHCSANGYIQQTIPKEQWNWDGVMISDWGGAHQTLGTALGGLDVEMPDGVHMGQPLLEAVRAGKVGEDVIDNKVRRLIRLMYRTKLFNELEDARANTPEHQMLAKKAACEGSVLLKNEGDFLPLNSNGVKSIAVIGPNADKQHSMSGVNHSGGSGAVMPPYEVTPLAGLRNKLGEKMRIHYAPGYQFEVRAEPVPLQYLRPAKIEGLRYNEYNTKQYASEGMELDDKPSGLYAEYFKGKEFTDKPVYECVDSQIAFNWGYDKPNPKLPEDHFCIRWTGYLCPDRSGIYKLGKVSDDGTRLYLDGKLIVDEWVDQPETTKLAEVELVAGKEYEIRMEYYESTRDAIAKLVWMRPESDSFQNAVNAARKSDVVIFFAGTNHTYDKEALGWGDIPNADKPDLELIGPQAELIEKVAKVNPNTVVVLINGAPVSVEGWNEQVKAILECWYPGQEGGNAIADMLFGNASPSGKLACTFGKRLNDYACHANGSYPGTGNNGIVEYKEGVFVGYRYFEKEKIIPRYPFGYGLTYTSFKYSNLRIEDDQVDGKVNVRVILDVMNTGDRAGKEIVQLYISDKKATVPRPLKELKGFVKVALKPGETKTVTFQLAGLMPFAYYDKEFGGWVAEPGSFEILVGSSSQNIHLREKFILQKQLNMKMTENTNG